MPISPPAESENTAPPIIENFPVWRLPERAPGLFTFDVIRDSEGSGPDKISSGAR